jgi:2-dehydro-3-deoxyglucarate aldolase/4-hydroxy-2-oxoheptanedioate aldolase
MSEVSLRAMQGTRALKLGHFVIEFATPGIGHIVKNAGCDFVLFDTEHSGFGNETIKNAVRYFQAARLPAIVRVPSKDYHDIARALDMGAEGVMVPMVNDADEAERIVSGMKYTPRGRRGVAPGIAHDDYVMGPVLEKLAAANEKTTLFAQIESVAGVENADAIAAIDGVDCLWVGHFDLSCSLGIPGQFEHTDFRAAIERTVAAARRHGKALGRLSGSPAECAALYREGFDFICYGGDVWLLQAAIAAGVAEIRQAVAGAGQGTR